MGALTDLSLYKLLGAKQPDPNAYGIEYLRSLGIPQWSKSVEPAVGPVVWPPNSGEIATVYFPSDPFYESVDKKVTEATGSPLLGFAATMISPTMLFKSAPARKIFAGVKAKTADLGALAKAKQMEQAGVSPDVIMRETGWGKPPWENKWRFEIPDNKASFVSRMFPKERMSVSGNMYAGTGDSTIKDAIRHNKLIAAYPDASDIRYRGSYTWGDNAWGQTDAITGKIGQAGGSYEPIFRRISVGSGYAQDMAGAKKQTMSSTLHELQHPVQYAEGFARGGNPNQFVSGPMFSGKAKELADDLSQNLTGGLSATPQEIATALKFGDTKELSVIAKKHGFSNIDDAMKFLAAEDIKRTPYGQYQRLAGEAEARLTQARMNMTPAQRAAQYPWEPGYFKEATGVGLDDLIVRYGDEGAAMAIPKAPRDDALRIAQQNAAKPISKGGLGLRPDNTPMERAKAMGYHTPTYHATTDDFPAFDVSKRGTKSDSGWFSDAEYSAASPEYASRFIEKPIDGMVSGVVYQDGGNIMPLLARAKNPYDWRANEPMGRGLFQNDRGASIGKRRELQDLGYDSVVVNNSKIHLPEGQSLNNEQWNALTSASPMLKAIGKEKVEELIRANNYDFRDFVRSYGIDAASAMPLKNNMVELATFNPNQLRSRFAAFDPFLKDSSDLLAGIAPYAIPAGLLGSILMTSGEAEAKD